MSGSRPTRVDEALEGYLKKSGLGDRMEEASAVEDWADRVGEQIAAVTEPLHTSSGVLFIGVRSSAWLMELRMMEAEIRRRLNEGRDRGRIRQIRFVMAGGEDDPERRGRHGRRSR